MFHSQIEPDLDDGSGFAVGQHVFVDDIYSQFYGTYLGLTKSGLAKVRDDDTGETIIGSIDFVEHADRPTDR